MKFYDDISQRNLSFYDSARADAIDALCRNFDALAIYEFGSVKVPGISDIDLMMILNSGKPNEPTASNASDVLPDRVRSIAAGGTVMVLDAYLFSTINTWDDIQTKRLWGKHLDMAPTSFSPPHMQLARMVDWVPERTLRLAQMIQMDTVKTSRAIGIVYSLCHSLRKVLAELKPGNAPQIRLYVERIDDLRTNWFNSGSKSRESELSECIHDGFHLAKNLLPLLAHQLDKIGLTDNRTEGEFNLGRTGRLLFRREEDAGVWASDENAVVLPTIFYEHFRNYALGSGNLSRKIHAAMRPKPFTDGAGASNDYTRLLSERIDWVEHQAKFLISQDFTSGLYKFGWFFSASSRGVN